MAATLTGAGLPPWVSAAWTVLVVVVPAATWISGLSALVACVRRARGRSPALGLERAGATLSTACAVVVVAFGALGRVTSSAPGGEPLCYRPTAWLGEPDLVCTASWPIALLFATLAVCAGGALFGTGIARLVAGRSRSGLVWLAAAALFIVVARAVSAEGFVSPDPLRAGGIEPLAQAAGQAMTDLVTLTVFGAATLTALSLRALRSPVTNS